MSKAVGGERVFLSVSTLQLRSETGASYTKKAIAVRSTLRSDLGEQTTTLPSTFTRCPQRKLLCCECAPVPRAPACRSTGRGPATARGQRGPDPGEEGDRRIWTAVSLGCGWWEGVAVPALGLGTARDPRPSWTGSRVWGRGDFLTISGQSKEKRFLAAACVLRTSSGRAQAREVFLTP